MLYYDGQEHASLEEQVAINKCDIESLTDRVDSLNPEATEFFRLHAVCIDNSDLNYQICFYYKSTRPTAYPTYSHFLNDLTKIFTGICYYHSSGTKIVCEPNFSEEGMDAVYHINYDSVWLKDVLVPAADTADMTFTDFLV